MNSFRSYALEGAFALAAAAFLAGCGNGGAEADYADGVAAYEARDLKKAERLFDQAARAAVTNADAYIYLARTRLELGQMPAAREAVAKAVELAGGDADVRLLEAQISYHAKEYARAIKAFRLVAEDKSLTTELRAQAWAGLGVVEMSADNADSARVAFLMAMLLDRRNAAARYHLGLLYRDSFGYPEASLEQLEAYVRLDDVASTRVQKVQRTIIPELKRLVAQTAANRPGAALRNRGQSAEFIQKADVAFKHNSFKTARRNYSEALRADPLSYPAALGLAKTIQKSDQSRSGLQQALTNYRLACSLKSDAIQTFITTGDLALRLGQNACAVEVYSRALAASPKSVSAIDGLIRSLRKVGNRTKAAQAYQSYRDALSQGRR